MMTKMNMNEMEQVNGGDFIDDAKDILKRIFAPEKPGIPNIPNPIIATMSKKDPAFKSFPELG